MSRLRIEDLHTHFVSRSADGAERIARALNGGSLSLDAGQTLGLVGESGAGKSLTALSVLGCCAHRRGWSPDGRCSTALAHTPLQLALALGLLGTFAAIDHPVGIPMLLQGASRPGWTIGVNGLAGNLGIAVAALVTGFLVKHLGWRAAFALPGLVAIGCGIAFARFARSEGEPAARRAPSAATPAGVSIARIHANYELLADRLQAITRDPALLGALLAAVYTLASFAQLVVGRLIDRVPLKRLYLSIVVVEGALLALSTQLSGWAFFVVLLGCMAFIFGSIPFTDAMLARYVDDRMRSRVAGLRLTVSLGASSAAVWVLGPLVKAAGFTTLLWVMAAISLVTFTVVTRLPNQPAPTSLPRRPA